MSEYVVDASVAVKWFVPEKNSIRATQLFNAKSEVIVPDLLFVECANAVAKKYRLGEIDVSKGREVMDSLLRSPFSVYRSRELISVAFEIAAIVNQSVYDCLYLALALTRSCPLVTADEKFYRAVSRTEFASMVILL